MVPSLKASNNSNSTKHAIALTIFCLILVAPMFFLPVFSPDELWFYRDAEVIAKGGINPFSQQPHLGYGTSFWLVYALVIRLVQNQLFVLYL